MPQVPLLSGREVVPKLEKLGWQKRTSTRKSHYSPQRRRLRDVVSPDHKEVARGTLQSLIRAAGLTVEEFLREK